MPSPLNVKIMHAGAPSIGSKSFLQYPHPHTPQHHHSNTAILVLSPGPLQEPAYCYASSLFPSSQTSSPCFQPPNQPNWLNPQALKWLFTEQFLSSIPFFPNEKFSLAHHCPQSCVPKSIPSNITAPISSYENTRKKRERFPWKNNLENTAYRNSHWEIPYLH